MSAPSPAPSRRRWLWWLLAPIALVALLLAGLAWLLTGSLARLDGRTALPGLAAPATISRDALGIATVEAASAADAMRARVWPADTAGKRLALGMLWGWMPCGLSTTLLAAAWLQASAWHGALTMLAFGLGTLPAMVPLTWAGVRIARLLNAGGTRTLAGWGVIAAGVVTLAGPWLMQVPALHGVLSALGCRSLPG